MCTQYLREMHFLKSAALLVTPPSVLLPNKTRWVYDVNPCGNSFTTVSTPVSEAQYHTDVMQGGNAVWCYNWTAVFSPPKQPVFLSLRASGDPYTVAGLATNCSMVMPRTPHSYMDEGLGFLIPGVVLSTVAYFFLAGVCGDVSALLGGGARGGDASAPLLRGRAVGAGPEEGTPYGTGTAVELTAGRRPAPAAPAQ
jgi:hypothetical protein